MVVQPVPPAPLPTLVLASGSPRRRTLLMMAGFDFEVASPDVDETPHTDESPEAMVVRLAEAKALAISAQVPAASAVLACDTTVVLDGEILGKPESVEHAVDMLLSLGGKTHEVVTGYALRPPRSSGVETGSAVSQVTMRRVSPGEAAEYASGGEPMDKAGAYALQGEGARFVAGVRGSRSNVIGLPLESVVPLLARHGIRSSRR